MRERTGVADVLGTDTSDGEVRCSIGLVETGKGFNAGAAYWGPWSFISVPPAPTDGAAAMAWWTQDGNDKRILGYHDNRLTDRVGSLQPGDSAIVCLGEARVLVKAERDAVVLYSKNRATGKSMLVTVDAEAGTIQHRNGDTSIEQHGDKIVLFVSNGGSIVIDGAGVSINGNYLAVNTAGGHLGQIGGVIPPVGVSSIVAGPTGLAGVGSTSWTVKP